MKNNGIKLGVSLYSFTNEYVERKYSLENCLALTKQLGATGFEIVASQMVKGYPWPTEETIKYYRELFDRHELEPVSYGSSVDRGLRSDRDLSSDELFRNIEWDIRCAADLGCKVMRTQVLLSPEILEKVAPIAEKYGVKVGIEIHNPMTPTDEDIIPYTRMLERVQSPWIGFIPDFGMFQERPDKFATLSHLESGTRQEVWDAIEECIAQAIPKETALKKIQKFSPNESEIRALNFCYIRYKPSNFEAFKEIIPYVLYCHGKFYYITEDYKDPSIPYDTIIKLLKEGGFSGYICSEYEGHMFGHMGDPVELVRRHLVMERRLLSN